MRYRRSSVTMGRFLEVALLLVALGRVDAVSYLLANIETVEVVAGETEGVLLVDYPQLDKNATKTVAPYSVISTSIDLQLAEVTVGVETKAFVIQVFGMDMSIFGHKGNSYFPPLPISALGSRYVVSTCVVSNGLVVLVIANYNQKTDVDITLKLEGDFTYDNMTYNHGDTIHVSLDEYQTFTLKSANDLTGTVVNTTRVVAVFSGTEQNFQTFASLTIIKTFAQLLPVRHHGTEHVLPTNENSLVRDVYKLQVVSDQTDTEIILNNGSTFSLGDNRVYRQNLVYNGTLYFNTTRPVIATLCIDGGYTYGQGFVVVTPAEYFTNSAQMPVTNCINILTKQHVTDIEVSSDDMTPATVDWVDIPGSDYKYGIHCGWNSYFVHSANRFALYGFGDNILNGGYHFPADPSPTPATAAGGFTTESTNDRTQRSTPLQIPAGAFMGGVTAVAVSVPLVGFAACILIRMNIGNESPGFIQ